MLSKTDKTLAKMFSQKQMNEHNAIRVMATLRAEKAEEKILLMFVKPVFYVFNK